MPHKIVRSIRSILEFLPVAVSRLLETFGFEGESQLIS